MCVHAQACTHPGRYLLRSSSRGPHGHLEPGKENPDARGCCQTQKVNLATASRDRGWEDGPSLPYPDRPTHHSLHHSPAPPSSKPQCPVCAQAAPQPPLLKDCLLEHRAELLQPFMPPLDPCSLFKKCIYPPPPFLLFLILFQPIIPV